jgi:hypothetical protein
VCEGTISITRVAGLEQQDLANIIMRETMREDAAQGKVMKRDFRPQLISSSSVRGRLQAVCDHHHLLLLLLSPAA